MTNAARCYDVTVVGGGIAGACAAVALAHRGIEVALLEAGDFPRHKVCGEFLSSESGGVFKRLGLLSEILRAGACPIGQARVVVCGKALNTALPQEGLSLSRYQLDRVLWDSALAAGVQGMTNARVHSTRWQKDGTWRIETDTGDLVARNLIVASGRHNNWLVRRQFHKATPQKPRRGIRYFGMKAHFVGVQLEEGVVELHPFNGGYCGLVRIEDGITNVCLLARYDTLRKRPPHVFWAQILKHNRALAQRLARATLSLDWLTTGNLTFADSHPAVDDVLCCGDTAGFIAPLAGDGMAMAARSGELAAAVIAARVRGALSSVEAAQLYAAAWQREFGKRLRWARSLQALLTTPALTIPGFALFSHLPPLTRLAVTNTRSV